MRIAYILSNVNYSIAFEWFIDEMNTDSINFLFIFLNQKKPKLFDVLKAKGVKCEFIPLNQGVVNSFSTLTKVRRTLKNNNIEIVHTHLFHASIIGLLASKSLSIKKRIHTRHHSTYHHEYYPHAVKYDKIVNYLSTDIVAISNNVRSVLIDKEGVSPQKVKLIEHGFNLSAFENISKKRVDHLFEKWQIPHEGIIIGSIARYINWKGHRTIIEAFKILHAKDSRSHLVLANAQGPDQGEIKALLSQLPQESYTEISFEEDLFALYQCFDVFVHVPINEQVEAFGQTYVEALAAGIPSVFTLSGIALDFVSNRYNAIVVKHNQEEQVVEGVLSILKDQELRSVLIQNGRKSVEHFSLKKMTDRLAKLYN